MRSCRTTQVHRGSEHRILHPQNPYPADKNGVTETVTPISYSFESVIATSKQLLYGVSPGALLLFLTNALPSHKLACDPCKLISLGELSQFVQSDGFEREYCHRVYSHAYQYGQKAADRVLTEDHHQNHV